MTTEKKIVKVKTLPPKKLVKPHENSFSKNKSAVPAEISSLHSEEKLSIINHKNFLQETKTHILTKKSRKKNRKNDLVKNLLLWFQYKVPHSKFEIYVT